MLHNIHFVKKHKYSPIREQYSDLNKFIEITNPNIDYYICNIVPSGTGMILIEYSCSIEYGEIDLD